MKLFKYVSDGQKIENPRNFDEVMGRKKVSNFAYSSLSDLERSLKTMNLVDVQKLAVSMGIKASSDRSRLVRAVVDQYKRHSKTYGSAIKNEDLPEESFDISKFK